MFFYKKADWNLFFFFNLSVLNSDACPKGGNKKKNCTYLQLLMWLLWFYTSTFVCLQLSGEFSHSVYMHIHNVACYLPFPGSAHDRDITWNIFQRASLRTTEARFCVLVSNTSAMVWLTWASELFPFWPSVQWPFTINLLLLIFWLRYWTGKPGYWALLK